MFVHHVFFWLKEDTTSNSIASFETALKSLLSIEHIQSGDIGKPAATEGGVIDTTYAYSLLTIFASQEEHDKYQVHPGHQKFVEENNHLWSKVVVYDSETL